MARRSYRFRVDDFGALEVVDPGFDVLDLLKQVDPEFRIASQPLHGFESPGFMRLREMDIGATKGEIGALGDDELWKIHDQCLGQIQPGPDRISRHAVSLLDLKIELAGRMLRSCRLCARRCGANRIKGEHTPCGLGISAYAGEYFVHIAEESPVNPSFIFNLMGCGMRCRFCQQHELLDPSGTPGRELDSSLWSEIDMAGARSLSFAGGNPDESLYGILKFIRSAPEQWNLPVIWNSHGYQMPDVLRLLDGIVDAYVPDLKYMSESCAKYLSRVNGYPAVAKEAIKAMVAQSVPVYVRLLVLPGHLDCCHIPALDYIRQLHPADNLFVSIRGQYAPDYTISEADGVLARRSSSQEVNAVHEYAKNIGLQLID